MATGCRSSWYRRAVWATDQLRDPQSITSDRGVAAARARRDHRRAGVPHTRTGRSSVPIEDVRRRRPGKVVERSAVDNPDLLDWYASIEH